MYNHILVAKGSSEVLDPTTRERMFRFRTEMFLNRLRWEVPLRNGLDIDVYDDLDPVYFNAINRNYRIEACGRLLPTTGPYMLPEIFPTLLRGEEAPRTPSIWELSRFAVTPCAGTQRYQAAFHPITTHMLQSFAAYARGQGITHYVIVTTTALERLLLRMGLSMRRFGDGIATRIGRTLCVAAWIKIDRKTFSALGLTHFGI